MLNHVLEGLVSIPLASHSLCERSFQHGLFPNPSLPQHVLNESLAGLVRGTNQGPAGAVEKAHVESPLLPHVEFGGRNVSLHLEVSLRRLHVLPKRDHIHVGLSKFCRPSASRGPLLRAPA